MLGMAGGSAGQFLVGPLVSQGIAWNRIWIGMGIVGLLLAVALFFVLPKKETPPARDHWFKGPARSLAMVARNPQSILCGLIAGLLFLPTNILDMIWGVRFLQDARGFSYADAVIRSATVPVGWIIGCPLLGLISDRLGRRKTVIIGGSCVLFVCLLWTLYGPTDVLPPYVLGLVAGVASGAAMIPYTVMKGSEPAGIRGHSHRPDEFPVLHLQCRGRPDFRVGHATSLLWNAATRGLSSNVSTYALRRCVSHRLYVLSERDWASGAHSGGDLGDCMNPGTGKYEALLERCAALDPIPTAVAHPCEKTALEGAMEAGQKGLIIPILVGPASKIESIAKDAGIELGQTQIVDVPHSHASAAKAAELVREGCAELIMKGSLHSDELLGAVVARDAGLRTERRISHVFIMDVPTYYKVLIVTDAAINITPSLDDKADICRNAIDLAISLGVKTRRSRFWQRSRRLRQRCHPRSTQPLSARWRSVGKSRAESWMARWLSITRSASALLKLREFNLRFPGAPTFSWSRTWRLVICSPSNLRYWLTRRVPGSCSGLACRSF